MEKVTIDLFKEDIRFRRKIEHVETIPAKEATYKKVDNLNNQIKDYLDNHNIQLYAHQADSYNAIKNGENIIITTSTASGKTLSFNLPIMDTLIEDKSATALYIYPAKALSNDQLHVLEELEKDLDLKLFPKRYDGDTDKSIRPKIREKSRVVLTNPFQLHHILSWHHQWKRFYSNLRYVVIDESHYYKGVFGSNVAFLIRRLKRILNYYGAYPQFILSSATLANPLELANKLTGEDFILIDNDSSPHGEKDFILYNPFKNKKKTYTSDAPSIHLETEKIFLFLIINNIQTLCFTVSRKMTELIVRWSKKDMDDIKPKLVERIASYRAGYSSEERKEIVDNLKSRKYLGVTCTNALELGIDIGSLEAVIISGYPGTMISTWQQSGRSGRSKQKSIAILVAFENQLDQYFMKNPSFFFDKAHENAIIDLSNKILQKAHLICASHELVISKNEVEKYFGCDENILDKLVKTKDLVKNNHGNYFYPYDDTPSFNHDLDQISSDIFSVICNGKLLEKMERSYVYKEAHKGAVFIYKGETYIVESVNLARKFVNVIKQEVDFHTMVLKDTNISITKLLFTKTYGSFNINFGQLVVKEDYFKYKKIHFSKVLGSYELNLPPLKFKTKGFWFIIPDEVRKFLEDKYDEKDVFAGGLHGVEHALIGLFPLHVMSDRFDIGGLSTNYHIDTKEATIFVYDAYEGGIGITEKAVDVFKDLLKSTINLLKNCDCKTGCPSCIYSPKCGNDNKPLHKEATIYILKYMYNSFGEDEKLIDNDFNKEFIEDDPYIKALNYYNEGNYSLSKELLADLITIDSKNADAWYLIGKILFEQDDIKGASNFIKKTLAIDSGHLEANDLMIKINKFANKESAEEDTYSKALKYYNEGNYILSKEILSDLINFDSNHVDAWFLIGKILLKQGDIYGAYNFTRKALSIDSSHIDANELMVKIKKLKNY